MHKPITSNLNFHYIHWSKCFCFFHKLLHSVVLFFMVTNPWNFWHRARRQYSVLDSFCYLRARSSGSLTLHNHLSFSFFISRIWITILFPFSLPQQWFMRIKLITNTWLSSVDYNSLHKCRHMRYGEKKKVFFL